METKEVLRSWGVTEMHRDKRGEVGRGLISVKSEWESRFYSNEKEAIAVF